MWKHVHRFILWFPIAFLGGYSGVLGVLGTAAQAGNSQAREWLDSQFIMLRAMTEAYYLPLWVIASVATWLAAFLWSGHKAAQGSAPQSAQVPRVRESTSKTTLESLPNMPGFSAHLVVKLHYVPSRARQLIIHATEQNGASVTCFFAAGESFTLAVIDRHGDEHSLPIPFTRRGVPIGQLIDLSLAVGADFERTIIRVGVNGRTVDQRILPLSIGLIQLPWTMSIGDRLATEGAVADGVQGAGFDLYEAAVWDFFLGGQAEVATSNAVTDNWKIRD